MNSSNEMPDDIFRDLTKLRNIIITVSRANKKIFKNLNELETLDLTIKSSGSLNNFDTNALQNVTSFKTLKLYYNSCDA